MSQTIQLPDDLYHAIEVYASQHHQTPNEAIFAWAKDIQRQVEDVASAQSFFDPWAGFLTEATDPDVTIRHDYYLAEETIDTHESK